MLPAETAEVRAAEDAIRRVVHRYGYREVRTPVLEFAAAIERAAAEGLDEAYRLFDAAGDVLVLRPDLTIPTARLIATRMADHRGPIRVNYTGPSFRLPQPGSPRASEHRQAGAELVGAVGPDADAEIITLLCECLAEVGLTGFRVAVGDAGVIAAALDASVDDGEQRARMWRAAAGRDLVAWRRMAGDDGPLAGLLARRGGAETVEQIAADIPAARDACTRLAQTLERVAGAPVMVDLGIVHNRSYYDGIVLEAYADGVGQPVARGGRYDALGARFGTDRPAVGFGIELDPLHRALAHEAAATPMRAGVVLVGGLGDGRDVAAAMRTAGLPVVALAGDDDSADDLAQAHGWRYVARPDDGGYRVHDRRDGTTFRSDRLEEDLPSRP